MSKTIDKERRASDDILEGQLSHLCGSNADTGMLYQLPEQRLPGAVSKKKEIYMYITLAFWIVAIDVEHGSVDHFTDVRTVQRRTCARSWGCVTDASWRSK
jgi:hypothetical protein